MLLIFLSHLTLKASKLSHAHFNKRYYYFEFINLLSISSQLECILEPVKQLVCEFTDILEKESLK